MRRRLLWLLALPVLAGLFTSCGTVGYLAQAAWGQVSLLASARPIPEVLADPATPAETRRKLELAGQVRAFALTELGLPQQRAFTTYVQLSRRNVSWSVVAAPELSLTQRTWCFPIAGCVTYKGYFSEAAARAEAERYRAQGDDVDVQEVPAYSTLGYLPDPLLSTTLEGSDLGLIRLLIHELSHAAVYAPGDTTYNESFATAVERYGTRRWLAERGTPEQARAFEQDLAFEAELAAARAETRRKLEALYAGPLPDDQKRAEKVRLYEELRAALNGVLERRGFAGRWPAGRLNNANLGQAGAYALLVPAFEARLAREGGDLRAFIAAAKACAARPQPEREACLRAP